MPDYTGSIQLGEKPQAVAVSRSAMGKITIRIGGSTVYDEKPFVMRQSMNFSTAGRPGTLTWRDLGPGKLECDISIDGKTTTLSRIDRSGRVTPPMDAVAREKAQAAYGGMLFLAGGVGALVLNYFELGTGHYYPKYLAIAPTLVFFGIFLMVKRPANKDWNSNLTKWMFLLGVPLMLAVGWIFSRWFLATFATP